MKRRPLKKEVVILEHVASEKAGTILGFLKARRIPYREVRLSRITAGMCEGSLGLKCFDLSKPLC